MPDAPAAGSPCTPFLRWAGSKRSLIPVLQKYWKNSHRRYLEPFAGSACLFFALKPPRAILGDLNSELISTYLEIKYRLEAVNNELEKLPAADKAHYLRLRSVSTKDLKAAERAARFIYLNRFCFNGIYRTNLNGDFNVPFSGARCGTVPSAEALKKCATRLRTARLVHGDFEKVLEYAQPGDLVYMDPPFAVRERRVFRQYDPSTFTHKDIARLREWMDYLTAEKIDFVVSYAECDEANLLKKGYEYQTVTVRRNIAGFAAHRAKTNEIMISNFAT
jgi:DNA adenine methylase